MSSSILITLIGVLNIPHAGLMSYIIHAVFKRCALMLVGMCAVGLRVLLGVRVFLYVFA